MTTEKEALQRVQGALFHLRKGLAPFVEARMKAHHGANWLQFASRARGGSLDAPLDEYGLLKTMLDHWRPVFDEAFERDEKHRVRNFASMAFEARNAVYHWSRPLEDDAVLRYLDAMHQLLKGVRAPKSEVIELKRLYNDQRHIGITASPARARAALADADNAHTVKREQAKGTIEDRLLEYVRKHPDLDDDELSLHLDIRPRQTINQAAWRLEASGYIRRVRGPHGKIVNRAREGARSTRILVKSALRCSPLGAAILRLPKH